MNNTIFSVSSVKTWASGLAGSTVKSRLLFPEPLINDLIQLFTAGQSRIRLARVTAITEQWLCLEIRPNGLPFSLKPAFFLNSPRAGIVELRPASALYKRVFSVIHSIFPEKPFMEITAAGVRIDLNEMIRTKGLPLRIRHMEVVLEKGRVVAEVEMEIGDFKF